jgi:ComF family protein
MRKLLRPFEDFLVLFFPKLCPACGENLPPSGDDICTSCNVTLPFTNFHLKKDNLFTERFWGRVPIETGSSMFLFNKGSRVQNLLHNLKYNGKKEIGEILGRKFGRSLRMSPHYLGIDVIVPVPLHPEKEFLRGYNQSEMFARGLSESMRVPYLKEALKRVEFTESQTKKNRLSRLENVKDVFQVQKANLLVDKHVLLVDDVMTTGSTLEACANELLKVKGTQVSMVTIALAFHS